jgi:hypothetical protein
VKATANGDPENEGAFRRITVGQVDNPLRPPQHVTILGALQLGVDRQDGQPHRQGRVADRLDDGPGFRCQLRRLAYPVMICVIMHQPRQGDRERRLIPGGGAQLAQFIKAGTRNVDMDSRCDPAQHGARGDAHGGPVGVIGW